ncbi:MAG: hypothetical protein Q9M22_05885, partial [Mariprofundaceae bacterium]|nr:hypothetical protein [Mariprofundaceae bacterium]
GFSKIIKKMYPLFNFHSLQKKNVYCIVLVLFLFSACNEEKSVQHQYPATNTAAFHRFVHQCSYCHVPPLPSQHKAQEWPRVVTRMMQHRAKRGLRPIPHQEQIDILKYLQHYAAERV